MPDHKDEHSKSLETWIREKAREREYVEGESHVLEIVESPDPQVDESTAAKTLARKSENFG